LLAAATALALAACGTAGGGSAVETPEEQLALEAVIGLLRMTDMNSNRDAIEDVARVAQENGWQVVEVESQEASERIDVFGWLTFLVPLDGSSLPVRGGYAQMPVTDLGPVCFRVPFDFYGKHGERGTADGIQLVDCPTDAADVELPPEEVVAVAGNAREAAHEVLEGLPESDLPSEAEIAARVADLLDPPDDEHTTNASPSALVDGSDVGIAMGGPDDCVLVARIGGVVADVHVPSIYLEVGELGCRPETALVEDLRPPH
jgi:hypothetical protein